MAGLMAPRGPGSGPQPWPLGVLLQYMLQEARSAVGFGVHTTPPEPVGEQGSRALTGRTLTGSGTLDVVPCPGRMPVAPCLIPV